MMLGQYSVLAGCGSGSTSQVYKALEPVTGEVCAIKRIPKSVGESVLAKERRMAGIMRSSDCPFVASIYDVFEEQDALCVVTEYCAGGSLAEVCETRRLSLSIVSRIFYEMMRGLEDMHRSSHVIHRDLKLENILLDKHGHVRLSDFGLSTHYESDEPLKRTACGSPAYAAPEVITRDAYTSKVDIWSAGVILYFLAAGRLPFDGNSVKECFQAVLFQPPAFTEDMSKDLVDLLSKMLEKDCEKRITASDVFKHPWMLQCDIFGIETVVAQEMEKQRETVVRTIAGALGEECDAIEQYIVEDGNENIRRTFRIVRDKWFPDLIAHCLKEARYDSPPEKRAEMWPRKYPPRVVRPTLPGVGARRLSAAVNTIRGPGGLVRRRSISITNV